ncbi:MAG TPA: hypothetical protein VG714_09795 [Acidobacteriaceae bacterium]|nr:hypothetical protein [Acidobacteriaceae bacterium]
MDLRDLLRDRNFARRKPRQRDPRGEAKALRRLAAAIAAGRESVLQELCEAAIAYCGADSAGISLLETSGSGEQCFRWIAIAGSFSKYLHGTTPRNFSPCGTTLDRDRPQLYRVTRPYYDFLGVEAEDISEGMLIPWVNEDLQGTLWAVSHHSRAAFCFNDYRLLHSLAEFAAVAVHHMRRQEQRRAEESHAASAAMANDLAHQINNPLQSLTNALYLAQQIPHNTDYLSQATLELEHITDLVRRILSLQSASAQPGAVTAPEPPNPVVSITSSSTDRRRRKYPFPGAVA